MVAESKNPSNCAMPCTVCTCRLRTFEARPAGGLSPNIFCLTDSTSIMLTKLFHYTVCSYVKLSLHSVMCVTCVSWLQIICAISIPPSFKIKQVKPWLPSLPSSCQQHWVMIQPLQTEADQAPCIDSITDVRLLLKMSVKSLPLEHQISCFFLFPFLFGFSLHKHIGGELCAAILFYKKKNSTLPTDRNYRLLRQLLSLLCKHLSCLYHVLLQLDHTMLQSLYLKCSTKPS